jgi:hypothetical protein
MWPSIWCHLAKLNCILRATLTEDNLCREVLSVAIHFVVNKRITLRKIRDTMSLNSDNTDTNVHGTLMLKEVRTVSNMGQEGDCTLQTYRADDSKGSV